MTPPPEVTSDKSFQLPRCAIRLGSDHQPQFILDWKLQFIASTELYFVIALSMNSKHGAYMNAVVWPTAMLIPATTWLFFIVWGDMKSTSKSVIGALDRTRHDGILAQGTAVFHGESFRHVGSWNDLQVCLQIVTPECWKKVSCCQCSQRGQ